MHFQGPQPIKLRFSAPKPIDPATLRQEIEAIPHPLDRPEVHKLIESEFNRFAAPLREGIRPVLSSAPDELENWETSRILLRRNQFGGETAMEYLARALYEETFSVNQNPSEKISPQFFRGIPGFTLGGLISHFYPTDAYDRELLLSVASHLPSGVNSLKEALFTIPEINERQKIVEVCLNISCLIPPVPTHLINILSKNPLQPYQDTLDSIGFRLLQVVGNKNETQINKGLIESLHKIWRLSAFKLIRNGSFKLESETGVREGIESLLDFRTNPQNQILFKYFSPSGLINSERSCGER